MSGVDRMTVIERCWIWERRSPMDDEVRRGVMFHEPDASTAMLDRIEEFVPAEQLRGAVEAVRTLRDYLTSREGEGSIRYMQALDVCDSILGLPDGGQ